MMMKLLSVIFFITAFASAVLSVLSFFGVLPGRGKDKTTGIAFIIASAVSGICELVCIWGSPKGLVLIISGVLLINLVYTIAIENEKKKNE